MGRLTKQQAAMLREFGNPDEPHEHTDMTLMQGTGYRSWPTMDNLVRADLAERVWWEGGEHGWLYRLTAAGIERLRELRSALSPESNPEGQES